MTKLNKKEQIEFYENKRLDERVVRWDAYRINQLSYANNLLLTLNLAFLGFLTTKNTLELAPGFLLGSIQILCGVSLIASFVSGLLLVLNRLKDFRLTAKLTKKRRRNKREKKTYCSNLDYEINKLRKKTKYLGNRSWCLFNWQIWTFSIGVILGVTFLILQANIGNMENSHSKIGILAYGSLIDNPGEEITAVTIKRIACETPFEVEYARSSKGRGGAPTLIPYASGAKVNAKILILDDKVSLTEAKNMLYRRETGLSREYSHSENPGVNTVIIKELSDFEEVKTVLYTSIGSNIDENWDAETLADLAIKSLKSQAGENKRDGVSYLLNAIANGIITPLTNTYKEAILNKTHSTSLEEVYQKREELE